MHIVLLGDSIFDNAPYVRRGETVHHHLQHALGTSATATLVAVDGETTVGIRAQLERVPANATHLGLNIGGNDALGHVADMAQPAQSVNHALMLLREIQREFARRHDTALQAVVARGLPVLVCTIYDAVPDLPPHLVTALSLFNDVITRGALRYGLDLLDLRELMRDRQDYSPVSPIEPSEIGGRKIAGAVAHWLARQASCSANASTFGAGPGP